MNVFNRYRITKLITIGRYEIAMTYFDIPTDNYDDEKMKIVGHVACVEGRKEGDSY